MPFRARAAAVLTRLAAQREQTVRGPGLRAALAWFDANDENLAAALRTYVDSGDRREGIPLLRNLLWPWAVRERGDDLRRAVGEFADADAPLDSEARVVVESLALFSASFPKPDEPRP